MNTFYCVNCASGKNFSIKYSHTMFFIRSDNEHFPLIILLIINFYRSMADKIYLCTLLNIIQLLRTKVFKEICFAIEKQQEKS